MPDIAKITLPNGNTYDIKDEVARSAAGAGLQIEVVTTLPTASSSTMGKIYLKAHDPDGTNNYYDEYVTVRTGTSTYTYSWELLGTTEVDLSNYSVKTHTHTVTSQVSVWPHTYTPEGTITAPVFSDGSVSASGSYTPAGSLSVSTSSLDTGRVDVANSGNVYLYTSAGTGHQTAYTLTGTNSSSSVSFGDHTTAEVPKTTAFGTVSVAKVTANGSNGTAASCTLPTFSATVLNEVLTLGWTDGSFTPNTATVLPTFGTETVATYNSNAHHIASPITELGAATAAAQTFTADPVYPGYTATSKFIKFTGTAGTVNVSGTATGTVSAPEFTGTEATLSHNVSNGTATTSQASA